MTTTTLASPDRCTLPWWASPTGISAGFLLPVLFLIAYVGQTNSPGLVIRGLPFLSMAYIGLGAVLLLITSTAGWLGSQVQLTPTRRVDESNWDRAALCVGAIALVAYVVWFKDFFLNPMLIVNTLMGSYRPSRDNIELMPGITSLVNVGPVFLSIYAYRALLGETPRPGRAMHVMCGVMVFFTAFRVYAWSERLALVEALVPFALAFGARLMSMRAMLWVWIRRFGPYAALPALIFYFGVAEYFRSWTSSTYSSKSNFWEFAIGRFASYYYTSLNNGAGLLATTDWPNRRFEHVLLWLHNAPMSVGETFSDWVGFRGVTVFHGFLRRFGDPEFNNPSGLYSVIADLGLPLGMLYFMSLALVGGFFFRAYRQAKPSGVLFYPVFFISFLEVFRYPYMGAPRTFTWLLGVWIALILIHFLKEPRRAATPT
jgi:hypothetical protein